MEFCKDLFSPSKTSFLTQSNWLWRGCGKDEVEEKDHLPSGAGDPSGKSSCVHEKTSCSASRKVVFEGENKSLQNSMN